MKVGYVRVSTTEQNTARQEDIMEKLGVERVFIDKLSGKNRDRPELEKMMEFVRDGDVLVVESYSRLSRTTFDLFDIVAELEKKGVQFISQKENIDTTSPQGKMMFTVFAGIAQFERDTILQKQREGIDIAKGQGKYKGRKRIEVDWEEFKKVYKAWKTGKCTGVEATAELGLKKATFYRKVQEFELLYPNFVIKNDQDE